MSSPRHRVESVSEGPTRAWAAFHLNLMFSSIEEDVRPAIVERCYWPLLRAVERTGFPIGLEATGYTLRAIEHLDPAWLAKLRDLISRGLIEPIASGEAQLIGPLAPASVNRANLRLGNQTYEALLGRVPSLVLVNEQCFSRSMIDHYIDAGYRGFIADWDNVHLANPDWDPALRYAAQRALSPTGRALPVLWSLTVAFQKFQRLAHCSDAPATYRHWLDRQIEKHPAALNLYCNDVEIFDFRPGRFEAEPRQSAHSEWGGIEALLQELRADPRLACVLPSDILGTLADEEAPALELTTAATPLPTKKQEKYNVLRWAATGRDDIGINSRCIALAHRLEASSAASDEDWRELCYLYASDFRTHITERRWSTYRTRLAAFEARWGGEIARRAIRPQPEPKERALQPRADGLIALQSGPLGIELNAKRGLALHRLWQGNRPEQWLIGTIPFGYYDDIRLGADFYSNHLVFQQPGKAQVTDLAPVEAWLSEEPRWQSVYARIATALGSVEKEVRLHRDEPRLDLLYRLNWPSLPLGVLRLGHVTVNPEAFDADALWYATHNGGGVAEKFRLDGGDFDHGRPVSHVVSASTGLGMTESLWMIGDHRHRITITADREQAAIIPMVVWRRLRDSFFFRTVFSAGEFDDTLKPEDPSRTGRGPLCVAFSLTIDAIAA